MALESKLLLLLALLVFSSSHTEAKSKVTRMQFYMHDIVGGPNPTAVRVAGRTISTGTDLIATLAIELPPMMLKLEKAVF